MRVAIFIIAMLCFITIIEARHRLALPRNYIRNINKAILNVCTATAHKQVQDDEIYNCFKSKLTTCNTYANYSKFNAIREKCIKDKGCDCSFGIIIGLMIWIIIGIFAAR